MGLGMFSKSSFDKKSVSMFSHWKEDSSSDNSRIVEIPEGNPDPRNYKILNFRELRGHLLVEIRYIGCKNYEGRKILLFKNCTIKELMLQKIVDPHFSDNKKFKSPFARFEPTPEGWQTGRKLIRLI